MLSGMGGQVGGTVADVGQGDRAEAFAELFQVEAGGLDGFVGGFDDAAGE